MKIKDVLKVVVNSEETFVPYCLSISGLVAITVGLARAAIPGIWLKYRVDKGCVLDFNGQTRW